MSESDEPAHSMLGHSYRQDRRYFAVAEKHKGKESLAIYDAGDQYNLVRVLIEPESSDQYLELK
jgi:hypothetical protein